MNFAEKIQAEEERAKSEGYYTPSSSDYFNLEEGDNTFRILAMPEQVFERYLPSAKKYEICYTDCGYQGTPKFRVWVLDRKDNLIKIAKLPYTIGTLIAKYQTDEDYAFEDFPMPYDIKVNAKNAGTKEVEYTVTPRPQRTDVEASIMEEFAEKTPMAEIVAKMKDKQKEQHVKDGVYQEVSDEKKSQ